jgi:RNA polymerase sigma-70 factor (ECF subfamily)
MTARAETGHRLATPRDEPAMPTPEGTSSGPDDAALLRRACEGDAEAFRVIFDRHAPGVRRFLGDLLRDDTAADEATQETFVRAHTRLATVENTARLQSWLFGIARMISFEHLRARRRDAPPPDDAANADDTDRAPSPESALLSAESDRVLDDAMAELSEERRAALVMRLDHGLGYAEIAEAMGWSLQKVKNEIHRARLQLRQRLASYLDGAA